ncbi:MAG: carboxypeptidase regulatory-like domain-containing protein [Deltaproteobacteria bacterium]|nr:carboxypeptidase regulatory-like domain-containing protein [Deltaproteobacteria bacterium]
MRRMMVRTVVAVLLAASGGPALACHLEGRVICEELGLPVEGATVTVTGAGFTASAQTDGDGYYVVSMPETFPASYEATLTTGQGTIVGSATQPFTLTPEASIVAVDWVVGGLPGCGRLGCWLTGGGAKFSNIAGVLVAERGPKVSFGGNVNPSCSPEPGMGGQWNHVDHERRLFFQGSQITVDRCGNVEGIEPGSTSPVTPYNFIEFSGTGRLKGIAGNKLDRPLVCFAARAEDRNEPGSSGQRDGAYRDRYFLRVFDCSTGATLLVLETTAGAADPVVITDGNLQLHASSCATP